MTRVGYAPERAAYNVPALAHSLASVAWWASILRARPNRSTAALSYISALCSPPLLGCAQYGLPEITQPFRLQPCAHPFAVRPGKSLASTFIFVSCSGVLGGLG